MFLLNPQQEKSVQNNQGNTLIIAGAGSGKTRTLIAKIVHLIINEKVSPYHILAITFTNKAAREMRERVAPLIENLSPQIDPTSEDKEEEQKKFFRSLQIKTFHSFGMMLLRQFIDQLQFQYNQNKYNRNFSIIDPNDQSKIIKEMLSDYSSNDIPMKKILFLFSTWKNDFLYPDSLDFENKAATYFDDYLFKIDPIQLFRQYSSYLIKNNVLDFDDLISLTVKLFRESKEALDYVVKRWKYVLVDEYQDTNHSQEKIIETFIQNGIRLTAVGDDQQSIYGFRGTQITNIISFKKKYPHVKTFVLEENYRSTQPILNLANHVIAKNPTIFEKNLFTKKLSGEKPSYQLLENDILCIKWIIAKIGELKENIPLNEIAIFYRTNYQSRIIEDALLAHQYPYHILKGLKFYQRKEIKDLLAYLIWLINPRDQVAFTRMVNFPPRRIGEKSLNKIFAYLENHSLNLEQAFNPTVAKLISDSKGQKAFLQLGNLFKEARQKLGQSPHTVVNFILQQSGLQKYYENESDSIVRDQKLGNIDSFFETIDWFEKQIGGSLEDFISSIALGDEENETPTPKINLMTIHNSKGLEFKVVFLVGMEEGVFPHHLSMANNKEIEEERRLFYVAITRAKEQLYLFSVRNKYHLGNFSYLEESRFIQEISDEFLIKNFHSPEESPHDYF